jgi:hypothetical protein
MAKTHQLDKNDKKERKIRSFEVNNVALSNFYAPWSVLGAFGDNSGNSSSNSLMGNAIDFKFAHTPTVIIDWHQFQQFLSQRMNPKTVGERLRYGKQFAHVLQTGDAQPLLQVSPDKRIHAMKALASLARFSGCYDNWLAIKRRFNLTWTTGNEALATFERFFDDKKSLDSMLHWVREAIQVLPPHMGAIIRFNTLTGTRPNEAISAVRLLRNPETFKILYNEERQTLEYFRFPQIYLRRTKSAYISIVTKEQLWEIAHHNGRQSKTTKTTPTYEVMRFRLERKAGIPCHMSYCRKIYGSWLRRSGIESETVDLLQGRVPRTVFAKHYFTPDNTLRTRVLEAVRGLQKQLLMP